MALTYTVKKGDTLWEIAQIYPGSADTIAARVEQIAYLNHIPNPDLIYVGQVLKLDGAREPVKVNNSYRPTITAFGLQSNTDNKLFAVWKWDKSNTEKHIAEWTYDTGNGVWFMGSKTDVEDSLRQSTYDYPNNAKRVKFRVLPKSKTYKVGEKEVQYWTSTWSTDKIYTVNEKLDTPPTPSVSLDDKGVNLTAKVENLTYAETDDITIEFEIVMNNTTLVRSGKSVVKYQAASYSYIAAKEREYKVRCRAIKGKIYSEWSNYSSGVTTPPGVPGYFTTVRANQKSTDNTLSVYLEWPKIYTAKTYDIEYATSRDYFDGTNQTTTVSGIETTHYEIFGLEPGHEYFFRRRAVNADNKASGWSPIASVVLGRKPAAPTTWSSTVTAVIGEPINLYWVHNAEDGSSQTFAKVEVYLNEVLEGTFEFKNSTLADEKDKTSVAIVTDSKDVADAAEAEGKNVILVSDFSEGAKLEWRVQTAGVTGEFGDWSVQRTIDIYAKPELALSVTNVNGEMFDTLTSFPIHISALAWPNTQAPISYSLRIISNDMYETVDNVGNEKVVNSGDEVYSRHFDISTPLEVTVSANDVNLDNNIRYTVICTVAMDSGLTAETTTEFVVAWEDDMYEPNAEIYIDEDTLAAHIRPHCEDEHGNLIEDILLSVYRREYNGKLTEIYSGMENSQNEFVTDPHPALDYARYRIVATTKSTGAVSFCDIPGFPVNEKSVVIQWDEAWSNFEVVDNMTPAQPSWSGSLLKLPYNVDVSNNHKPDVALVEYVGREHPVSYYGTQLGESASWSVVIPKRDTETLYALRRLSAWMGDVYVREPSGSGYWANVAVTFSQKHLDVSVPVSISVTRVEGGM